MFFLCMLTQFIVGKKLEFSIQYIFSIKNVYLIDIFENSKSRIPSIFEIIKKNKKGIFIQN